MLVLEMKQYTTEDVMEDLRARVSASTQVAVAASLDVSTSFLNDVLFGRRPLSDGLTKAMGYERKIIFRKSAA